MMLSAGNEIDEVICKLRWGTELLQPRRIRGFLLVDRHSEVDICTAQPTLVLRIHREIFAACC